MQHIEEGHFGHLSLGEGEGHREGGEVGDNMLEAH